MFCVTQCYVVLLTCVGHMCARVFLQTCIRAGAIVCCDLTTMSYRPPDLVWRSKTPFGHGIADLLCSYAAMVKSSKEEVYPEYATQTCTWGCMMCRYKARLLMSNKLMTFGLDRSAGRCVLCAMYSTATSAPSCEVHDHDFYKGCPPGL